MDKRAYQRAIKAYTVMGCLEAYRLNTEMGEGPAAIAALYRIPGVKTARQADAAINAGRYIHNNEQAQRALVGPVL